MRQINHGRSLGLDANGPEPSHRCRRARRPKLSVVCGSLLWVLAGVACGVDNEVGNDGTYTSLGRAEVADTSVYPLRRLLIVEEDHEAQQLLLTLFVGDLPAADLGFADLRRVALSHNRAQIRFERPLSSYVSAQAEVESAGAPRPAEIGVGMPTSIEETPLRTLGDEDLPSTGVGRFLRSVSSTDYSVSAHVAAAPLPQPLQHVRFEAGQVEAVLQDPSVNVEFDDRNRRLELAIGNVSEADYLELDIFQDLRRMTDEPIGVDAGVQMDEDEADSIEAMVRTTLPAGQRFVASYELLGNVFSQGCFQPERPVRARVTQVRRLYRADPDGDWAVIHRHRQSVALDPDALAAIESGEAPEYCALYR